MPDLERSKALIEVATASRNSVIKDGSHGQALNRHINHIVFERFGETIREA